MSRALSAVALIAAYNEADIIEQVVRDLIANGLSIYFIDDGSTDDTAELVEPLVGRGVLAIERVDNTAPNGGSRQFAWERLLRRKAQLATELDADWFLHHDADEFREAPWVGVSLLEGIRRVDALGYNAIDFANLDFWPTHDRFQPGADVREAFPCCSDAAAYDKVQVRCWRKTSHVDLASSGGHDVRFDDRRVFPIRFISRHYPIRGQAHGERKVFTERRPRFAPKERARHWHVQYDELEEGASFVRDASELTRYDGDAVRTQLALRHRGVEALESSLAESQSALEAARCEAARQTSRIAEYEAVVGRMNNDLVAQQEHRLQVQASLDARLMELGEAHAQLAHLHSALHTRNTELIDAHAQLTHLHSDVEHLRQNIDARQRENTELHQDIVRRENHAAAQQRDIASRVVELQDLRGRLDAAHRSWSWRVTAPARALLRLVRGY